MTGPDLQATLKAEILAARLEGALRADPDLAAIWRAEAAVQEACASAWLEDLPLRPEDLLCRAFRDEIGDPDRDRAAIAATAILRGLHSPGDLRDDTAVVMKRIWALGGDTGPSPFTPEHLDALRQDLRTAPGPILAGLAVAHRVGLIAAGAPACARLAFVAADHALRGAGGFMIGDADPHDLVRAPRGAWVLQPSLALVDSGFRLWSVSRPDTVAALLAGLTHTLARAMGSLPMHRRWLNRARHARDTAHGSSHMPDLVRLLMIQPIIDTADLAKAAGITSRSALRLIDTATDTALIRKITYRNTYRAWATEPCAKLLGLA
ncbi:HTH DNA binding domain-containing protein [Loktanella atrilutea]|uniref:HTH DNA binding domain-containing protein n=1 Tax=Loktanella atrilutea TaxID=366533 RepID=A0A1M5EX12_LOKAT|nr:helix-turn-helix domain-containing protein [Loktanella atrilutea]SHF83561.1 HTH DNA binding domain-containing protein [Loktanella atrilutea]